MTYNKESPTLARRCPCRMPDTSYAAEPEILVSSNSPAPGPAGETQPLVSVCIPSYNCESFIGQAIESVLAQTHRNVQLVICDDCSSDGTVAVIQRYRDPRLRLIQNPKNLGIAGCWNEVLSQAQGKYIKFLCQDDYLHPDCLQEQTRILEDPQHRSVVMTFCRREIVGPDGRRIMTRGYSGNESVYRGVAMLRKSIRWGTNIIGEPGSVLFRAEVLPLVGNFAYVRPWIIDLDFWSRILLLGDVYATRRPLCAFRVSAGSMSVYLQRIQALEFCEFIDHLQADPRFQLRSLDCHVGRTMAHVNRFLRQVFYKFLLR